MKSEKYSAINYMIEMKRVEKLSDIFTIIPLSTVTVDMKINYSTLRRRVADSLTLTVRDLVRLAELFAVPEEEIFRLALKDYREKPIKG